MCMALGIKTGLQLFSNTSSRPSQLWLGRVVSEWVGRVVSV